MANINIRIDDNLKKDAENLFNDLGLNMTTATTMFLKQCLYCHGLPFEVRMDPFYSATNQAHLRGQIISTGSNRTRNCSSGSINCSRISTAVAMTASASQSL